MILRPYMALPDTTTANRDFKKDAEASERQVTSVSPLRQRSQATYSAAEDCA